MRSDTDLIFVYGHMRRGQATPARRLLERYGTMRSLASVEAQLYIVDAAPALVIEQAEARTVGEVYALDPLGEALEVLDYHHGLSKEGASRYRRVAREVEMETGGIQPAWMYAWAAPLAGATPVLDGDYLAYLG